MYSEFEAANTVVIAIAQEDTTLADHGKMVASFAGGPNFPLVADLNGRRTPAYDRVSATLIDKGGKVRQIFPMTIRSRPSWKAILGEVAKLPSE